MFNGFSLCWENYADIKLFKIVPHCMVCAFKILAINKLSDGQVKKTCYM